MSKKKHVPPQVTSKHIIITVVVILVLICVLYGAKTLARELLKRMQDATELRENIFSIFDSTV